MADEAHEDQQVVSDEPIESGEYEAPQGAALGDYELSGDPTTERPAEVSEPFKKIPTGTVHAYPGLEVGNDETSEMPAYVEPPPQRAAYQEEPVEAPPEEEAVSAPPEEEPAQEECDEAQFFIEQSLWGEAREIVETILVAYPGHVRAAELLARIDAGEGTPVGSNQEAPTREGETKDAFDLAAELAGELTDAGGSGESAAPAGEEFQVSVEQVFADFKKGLEKVVKPEDVDTHYDLGIAYKEMGLVDDALGEFAIARKGCTGKKKEIDCLTMSAMLHTLKGDFASAVECFKQALTSEYASGDAEKALRYELAAAYESAGYQGRALGQYLRVQKLDGNYRDVAGHVSRLQSVTQPEDDNPGHPPKGKAPTGAASRKVGYV